MNKSESIANLAKALSIAQGKNDRWSEAEVLQKIRKTRRDDGYKIQKNTPNLIRFFSGLSYGLTDCWYWTKGRDTGGYGVVLMEGRKRPTKAHRLSWLLFKGEIPHGMCVLHQCDVPSCCNPDHLWLGTQDDNMKDCAKKGRIVTTPQFGEKNPRAVLSNSQVTEMRKLREKTGMSYKKIALQYKVSTMTAFRAVVGQSWKQEVK